MPTKVDDKVLSDIAKRNIQQQQGAAVETPIVAPAVTTQPVATDAATTTPPAVQIPDKANVADATSVVQDKPVHAYFGDYANDRDFNAIAKRNNKSLMEVFADYQKWGNDTGNKTDFIPMLESAQGKDIKKTPQQIEDEEKKAKAQERLERFSNFLSHLGNFIGAAAFGAPSQTLEPAQQLTARQQAVREKTEALRRAYNDRFFEQMSKQRAIERQEQLDRQKLIVENRREDRKDKELQLRAEKNDAYNKYIESQAAKNDEQAAYWKAKYQALEEGKSYDVALKEARIAQARAAARRSNILADNAANGTETEVTVTKDTPLGPKTETRKEYKRPAGGQGNKGKGYGSGKGKGKGY